MRRAPHAPNRRMRDDCYLLQWHTERRPVDGAGEHCSACSSVDFLTLIDEIAKLAFAVGKPDAPTKHRRRTSARTRRLLLEFRTGPDRNVRNTRFGCRRANLAEASAAREPG